MIDEWSIQYTKEKKEQQRRRKRGVSLMIVVKEYSDTDDL